LGSRGGPKTSFWGNFVGKIKKKAEKTELKALGHDEGSKERRRKAEKKNQERDRHRAGFVKTVEGDCHSGTSLAAHREIVRGSIKERKGDPRKKKEGRRTRKESRKKNNQAQDKQDWVKKAKSKKRGRSIKRIRGG